MLVGKFFEEEIKEVVWNFNISKSPGPNDFNFRFLKFSWEFIKEDIMSVVNDFATIGVWPRGSNACFLYLIPKIDNSQHLNDFRSISLVGCMYKIISKALSLILKRVIGKVIDIRQSAFL